MSQITVAPGTPLARFLSDGWVTTRRNLLKIRRVPDILVFTLIQPIMFVLLFTYVYGGVIDIPGFLRTLLKIRYAGVVSFEYEKDADDPLAGLAESVGYVKGALAAIKP